MPLVPPRHELRTFARGKPTRHQEGLGTLLESVWRGYQSLWTVGVEVEENSRRIGDEAAREKSRMKM